MSPTLFDVATMLGLLIIEEDTPPFMMKGLKISASRLQGECCL